MRATPSSIIASSRGSRTSTTCATAGRRRYAPPTPVSPAHPTGTLAELYLGRHSGDTDLGFTRDRLFSAQVGYSRLGCAGREPGIHNHDSGFRTRACRRAPERWHSIKLQPNRLDDRSPAGDLVRHEAPGLV